MTETVRPLSPSERIPLVDVLRGVAILGVLVAYAFWNLGAPPPETWTGAERVLDAVTSMLVDTKFVTLFAFLFGVGTAQQWRRIEAHGQDVTPIHLRRMTFLLTAGLVHALLLRNGDILAPYALLGFVLLAARGRSNRELVVAAIVLAVLPYIVEATFHATGWKTADRPGGGNSSGLLGYWSDNYVWLRYWYLTNPLFSFPRVLALMIAGVLADRVRLIPRIAADRRLAWRVFAVALPLAIVLQIAVILTPSQWPAEHWPLARRIVLNQLYFLSAWSLAATYLGGFALLCQRRGWSERLSWLRAVGRMAFTNYLLQAVLIVPVCLAFGLFDTVSPLRALGFTLGVAAIEIPFSVWWLRDHAYGPIEWLWRRVSYGGTGAAQTAVTA